MCAAYCGWRSRSVKSGFELLVVIHEKALNKRRYWPLNLMKSIFTLIQYQRHLIICRLDLSSLHWKAWIQHLNVRASHSSETLLRGLLLLLFIIIHIIIITWVIDLNWAYWMWVPTTEKYVWKLNVKSSVQSTQVCGFQSKIRNIIIRF